MRLIVWLVSAWVAGGATPLENARRAQAMLGPRAWSEIIRVENTVVRHSYPAVVYALVFEEANLLWFYTDYDGTQSLSLHQNRLAQEKADLAPLLRAIDAGFTRFSVLPTATPDAKPARDQSLPNGCFIESLAAWRTRIEGGERIERPRLLSCYAATTAGVRGHTVLTYQTSEGFFLLDPAGSARPQLMPRRWTENPMALASVALAGARVLRARWISLERPVVSLIAEVREPVRGATTAALQAPRHLPL